MSWRDDEDLAGNYLKCKEGEKLTVKVKEIKKVFDKFSKFNYKKKDGSPILSKESQEPFHHVLIDDKGKELTIGSISLIAALRDAKVDVGDLIEINHSGRGIYIITIVKKGEEVITEELVDPNLPF